jgi:sugar phosphate isomerase/epimerase
MRPCISQVTTLPTPFQDDVVSLGQSGWELVELWLPKLETFLESKTAAEARALLDANGLVAAAAAGQTGLLSGTGEAGHALWDQFRRRLDWLAELGRPTLVLSADFPHAPRGESMGRAIEALGQAAELASARGVRVAFEFVSSGRFATSLDTAVALVTQVGAANLGVCLDLFHYYTGPSKFEDLSYLSPANLFWVQVCDLSGTPRELAVDADRVLPGDGDFQIGPLLDQLRANGYDGPVSVELLNPDLWAIASDRVAPIALQALVRTLGDRLDEASESTEAPA